MKRIVPEQLHGVIRGFSRSSSAPSPRHILHEFWFYPTAIETLLRMRGPSIGSLSLHSNKAPGDWFSGLSSSLLGFVFIYKSIRFWCYRKVEAGRNVPRLLAISPSHSVFSMLFNEWPASALLENSLLVEVSRILKATRPSFIKSPAKIGRPGAVFGVHILTTFQASFSDTSVNRESFIDSEWYTQKLPFAATTESRFCTPASSPTVCGSATAMWFSQRYRITVSLSEYEFFV